MYYNLYHINKNINNENKYNLFINKYENKKAKKRIKYREIAKHINIYNPKNNKYLINDNLYTSDHKVKYLPNIFEEN